MKNPLRRIAVAALSAVLLPSCAVEIQHELTESEANDIVVLLERNHISTKKEKEEGGREVTWKIAVPKAHAANSMLLLKENELPRARTKGLELFDRGSLIPTATEERAMFLKALAGELSRTFTSIDGVLDARVHINIPLNDDLSDKTARPEASAGVLIKYRVVAAEGKKLPPPPIAEEQVQNLVAHTVQDLKPQNVSVIMTPVAPPQPIENGPGDVQVLGMRMAAESVGTFQIILGFSVVSILGLVGYIIFLKSRELRGPSRPRVRPEG